jgi:hypothetical protein
MKTHRKGAKNAKTCGEAKAFFAILGVLCVFAVKSLGDNR